MVVLNTNTVVYLLIKKNQHKNCCNKWVSHVTGKVNRTFVHLFIYL